MMTVSIFTFLYRLGENTLALNVHKKSNFGDEFAATSLTCPLYVINYRPPATTGNPEL